MAEQAPFLLADRLTRCYGATVALDHVDLAAAVRAMIGLAGQYAAVDPFLTGRENLELVAELRHLPPSARRRHVDVLLERLGLAGAAGRLVRTYSGGMRRRLDLAAALIGWPQVLFLDEPTTGLDPRSRRELWDLISEQAGAGTTVLLTTQYMEEADRLAGQVTVLDRGRVIATGSPAELKAKVGGDHLELTVPDPQQRQAARELLGTRADPAGAAEPQILQIALRPGGEVPFALLAELARRGVRVSDLQVHRPTLEDVFLHLTGQPVPGPPATSGTDSRSPPRLLSGGGCRDREPSALGPGNSRGARHDGDQPPQPAAVGPCPEPAAVVADHWGAVCAAVPVCVRRRDPHPGISYADYLMPGAFILTVTASAVTTTGVGFAEDLASGAIDRFRSLPIARTAVLAGRMLSDAVRLLLLIAAMTAVGFAVGFRVHTGIGPALAGLALTIAFSWAMLYLALALRTAEATQAAGQTLMFLLTFLSSAFVPLATMPGWLQGIAHANPVTYAVDALRVLLVGGPAARPVLLAVAWTAGLAVVFVPLAVRRYRHG